MVGRNFSITWLYGIVAMSRPVDKSNLSLCSFFIYFPIILLVSLLPPLSPSLSRALSLWSLLSVAHKRTIPNTSFTCIQPNLFRLPSLFSFFVLGIFTLSHGLVCYLLRHGADNYVAAVCFNANNNPWPSNGHYSPPTVPVVGANQRPASWILSLTRCVVFRCLYAFVVQVFNQAIHNFSIADKAA